MFTRLQRVIDDAVSNGRIVGIVYLVARDGKVVFASEKGFADREAGKPVRRDTIFRLASVTKPFVAISALAMMDKGLIRLDDPVTRYLPYFTPKLADGPAPAITLRHLITHTSGLSYDYGPDPDFSDGLSDGDFGFEENFTRLAKRPLKFAPGSKWEYSVAIDVLGAVLAKVAGASLDDVVKHHVTGPLGIKDTSFHIADRARLATAYADATPVAQRMPDRVTLGSDENGYFNFAPTRAFNPKAFQSGGAGMVGTADGVLALLEALRKGGAGVLNPETGRAAITNQVGTLDRGVGSEGQRFGFVSAVIDDAKLANTPQSKGSLLWGGVYGNDWFVDIARGISVISMSNTALEGCNGQFTKDTRDALYADLAGAKV
ncbi:serine hydrolase domain-containing protein [Aestuariivirga sp. YIM B02566]|uniref:Beta-lactamase family protein n=1 Tax=Taklimakanibacter albus TaxID=2800327 RepID=A0ACC5RCF0_9HYPH|nr:serine hydrolase domain-containing protein [Aestuariivirga sp. YIM B02566]MBK1870389.1 beta-lactamase family protein [Aestuariivirga sp. YIM B02566]